MEAVASTGVRLALDRGGGPFVLFPRSGARLRTVGGGCLLLISHTCLLAMPLVMPKFYAIVAVGVLLTAAGCTSLNLNPTTWRMPSLASEEAPPGSSDWWKKHKGKAEFVVGEGWRVPGYEDFYDDQGRPIRAKVAKIVKQEKPSKDALLEDVEVLESVTKFKEQFGLGPDQSVAEQTYAEGEALFRAQKYSAATKKFKEAAARWPDSKLQQDAMFYLAESEFFDKQYPEAVAAYDELLEEHPNTPHLDKVVQRQFEIAHYWEAHHEYEPHWATTPNMLDETRPLFDTLGHALRTYEGIRLNDPTGPMADDSIMASANSYFLRGRYGDADYQYELLRNEYPRSDHQFEAHILGLQCKLRKYQGPDYDDTPLLEAKKLVKQLKVQFVGQLNSVERSRQSDIQAQLNLQLAERDMKIAKYFDDGKHFGSAKFYYSQIVREYPSTPLADQAKERFLALGGEPDHPESKMEWLTDRFPENAERKSIAQVPMIAPEPETRLATEPQDDAPADGQTIRR
jgi:outer membrane protein assembly factor BamD (BamD/ComL family)